MQVSAIRRALTAVIAVGLLTGGLVTVASAANPRTVQAGTLTRPIAAACVPGRRACPIPIAFERGAFSGQRSSRLTGITSERWFAVRARAGQTLVVVVDGAGPTRGVVYFPNGQQDGQPGGRVYDGPAPVTGVYRIRVTESLMAEAWSGRITVVVLIY